MLSPELLRKVKYIELSTRRIVDDMMSGQYKSRFKGQGVQFSDHRIYIPGDDVRHIDWKVSARTRDPMIKKFDEERELTALLIVDVSASEAFGSTKKFKSEVVAEIAGMLAYAATRTGDKMGVIIFSDHVEKVIAPKKGKSHIMRIIGDLLTFKPKGKGTRLDLAFEAADRVMKHTGVIFVLSDFLGDGYEKQLKKLSARHDVLCLDVQDERESNIPNVGIVSFRNPETGETQLIDTGSKAVQAWLKSERIRLKAKVNETLKATGADKVELKIQDDYAEAVVRYFQQKKKRKRR